MTDEPAESTGRFPAQLTFSTTRAQRDFVDYLHQTYKGPLGVSQGDVLRMCVSAGLSLAADDLAAQLDGLRRKAVVIVPDRIPGVT